MKPKPSPSRAEALRELADLLRSGLGMRAALEAWHQVVPDVELEILSKRVRLGADPAAAVLATCSTWGADATRLALIVRLTGRLGGDGAVMLEGFATAVQERDAAVQGGRAAAAGAVLSGRMVAGLPLAFLPLTPMARAPLFDGPGLLLLLAGLAFAAGGMWWIHRLVPAPPEPDFVAQLADQSAALVRGGVALGVALDHVTEVLSDVTPIFDRVRRLVRLGSTWTDALHRSPDPALVGLASTIGRAERTGTPVADALVDVARGRRRDARLAFEAAMKKAPVVMVVPLVLCVLPSFGLLALAPFLRGLTFSG